MLALPMSGQFEQELNAFLLAELGYGVACRRLSEDAMAGFLYRIPDLTERLVGYPRSDNGAITSMLDRLLDDGCRLARDYHRRRRSDA